MTCPTGSTSRVTLTPPSCCSASASLPLPCHPLVFIATKRAPRVRHRVAANVATRAKPHFVRPSRRSRRAPPLPRLRWSRGRTLRPPWVVARSARLWTPPPWRSVLETPPVARQPPRRDQLRRGLAGSWISGRLPRSLAGFSTSDDECEAVDCEQFARACDRALARSRTPLRRCGRQCDAFAERCAARRTWARLRGRVLPKAKNQRHEIEST